MPALFDAGVGPHDVIGDQPWVVDLHQEPGIDDRLVFFAHRFGQFRDKFGINWMVIHEKPMH